MGERLEKIEVAVWQKVKRRREMKRREGDDNGEWRERKKGEKIYPLHMHTCARSRGRTWD